MPDKSPSQVLMDVFEHASEAKKVGIILEQADGTIRFHCSSTSPITQLGLLTFAFLVNAGSLFKGIEE